MPADLNYNKETEASIGAGGKTKAERTGDKAAPEKKIEIDGYKEKILTEISRDRTNESAPALNVPAPDGGLAGISNQQKADQVRQKEVEKIMEENIEEIFISLPPEKQSEFKLAGERTAIEISGLMEKGRATMKKIMDLIKKWLSILPGVNKFFLEQEAKIKADKIFEIK